MRWASGEVRGRGMRLDWEGRKICEIAALTVHVDLRPWAASFGQPWRLTVDGVDAELDEAKLAALASLKREPSDPVAIEIEVRESGIAWTLVDGERIAARIQSARAIVRTGAALQAESTGEASILLETPTSVEARLRFRAVDGGDTEASVVASGQQLQELARFFPTLKDWSGSLAATAHLHVGDEFQRLRVTAEAAELRHPALPDPLTETHFAVHGDLQRALECEGGTTTARGNFAVEGLAIPRPENRVGLGSWMLELQARLDDCAIDEALEAQLAEHVPPALKILRALGLRGVARGRAGFRGSLSEAGLEEGWQLAVAAPATGIGLDYAGFENDRGETFAFPYPLAVTGGMAGWTGDTVLVVAEAIAGEAHGDPHGAVEEPTRIGARCAVKIVDESARVWLDLAARGVRLGAALQANPETGSLWYQLGAPRGFADVDVALRPALDEETAWSVRLAGRDLVAEPPDANLSLQLPRVLAQVNASGVSFTADVRTTAAQAHAQGRVRLIAGREGATDFACVVNGTGYLNAEERERLRTAHVLPAEFVEIEPGGTLEWTAALRTLKEGEASPPVTLLAELMVKDAAPSWPQRNASGAGWSLRAAAVLTPTEALLAVAPAEGMWKDARLQIGGAARLPMPGGDPDAAIRGKLTASLFESPISQDEVHSALVLLNADAWATGLRFAGKVSATVEVPLGDPASLRARLDLNPLHVVLQPGALGATAMSEPTRYMLIGALRLLDGAVTTQRLGLRGNDLDLVLEQAAGSLDEKGLSFRGTALSHRGVRLRPQLEVVAPPRVLASLNRIGLDGRIAPKRVTFDVSWPAGGTPRATASGMLELAEFDVNGPPPVRSGAGSVSFEEFVWNGPEDFHGSFRLERGTAVVSGVHLRDAHATVMLFPDRVIVTDFEAAALDGRVFTQLTEADGSPREGMFSLGLDGKAAVRADFGFEGFLLERMGEELGYRGPLAGRLDGRVDVRSSDPSPVNYRGTTKLHITDGILGAVPVLSQIWQLLGVEAPVFREGRLALQFLSEGRILVEELALQHPLLEVTGERMITMDSYLGLKVTVRTLGFFGRLPLIRDLMDLIVEQDVYGPASAPRLRQRGLGKIFQGDPERVPFPLWVPRTPLPDRLRSPVLPPGRILAPSNGGNGHQVGPLPAQ